MFVQMIKMKKKKGEEGGKTKSGGTLNDGAIS